MTGVQTCALPILMHCHVWRPDSISNDALAVVPFLEVVTSVLLMTGVDLGKEDHLLSKFVLLETLINEKVVALMHRAMTALAGSAEDLEASAESKRMLISSI